MTISSFWVRLGFFCLFFSALMTYSVCPPPDLFTTSLCFCPFPFPFSPLSPSPLPRFFSGEQGWILFDLSSFCTDHISLCFFSKYVEHCPVAVSAEAHVRRFLRREDDDQQLFGKSVFSLYIFCALISYDVCDLPPPSPLHSLSAFAPPHSPSIPFHPLSPLFPFPFTPTFIFFRWTWMNLVCII